MTQAAAEDQPGTRIKTGQGRSRSICLSASDDITSWDALEVHPWCPRLQTPPSPVRMTDTPRCMGTGRMSLTCSSTRGHSGRPHVWAVVSDAATGLGEQTRFQTLISLPMCACPDAGLLVIGRFYF